MNLLHMKYAVEIAETNSINKAAEKLYVGQPTLSRAIKELESNLGITIFDRSARGMTLTPDGEVFIRYARVALNQIDSLEKMFSEGKAGKRHFSIAVPRASYICSAFAKFSNQLDPTGNTEIFYQETNTMSVVKNILQQDYKLGIIRYASNYDRYYKAMLDEKNLRYELVTEFEYVLLMNAKSPLASRARVTFENLRDMIEIAHADPSMPSLPLSEVKKEELPDNSRRRIFVFERGSQLELLAQNPETFMWVSPVPKQVLERYGLVERRCEETRRIYKDMLIYRNDYAFSHLDKLFLEKLIEAKRETLG